MVYYLAFLNVLCFFLYGIDKYLAIKKYRRISEYTFFVLSFFGGSIGSIIGMKIFHHKTKKVIFWIINFLSIIMWIFLLVHYISINS